MEEKQRIIIGESERAGLPISAPIEMKRLGDTPATSCPFRWHKKKDSFSLEYWTGDDWMEVPCVE
jgi:hypothetical protein